MDVAEEFIKWAAINLSPDVQAMLVSGHAVVVRDKDATQHWVGGNLSFTAQTKASEGALEVLYQNGSNGHYARFLFERLDGPQEIK